MHRQLIQVLALTLLAATAFATNPTTRSTDFSPNDVDRLRLEIAELNRRIQIQEAEIERLRKLAGLTTTQPSKPAATQKSPATRPAPAAMDQDGPGLYRVSAGPGGRFTTTIRAKSREDAINLAMKTVAKKAMDYDENVEISTLKVEKIAN
jgi:uncharacterized small protein (DUF1192 family)